MQFKICTKCFVEKRLIDFPSNGKLTGDRKRSVCKKCFNLSKRKTLSIRSTKECFKICTSCALEKPLSEFNKCPKSLFGVRGKCTDCFNKVRRNNYTRNNEKARIKYINMADEEKNRHINKKSIQNSNRVDIIEYRKSYNKSDRGIFNRYKHDSIKGSRNYIFDLSFDQFSILISSNCYLCNKENCRGVDRFDNSIGYTIDNRPCCKKCNEIKLHYSYKETSQHITKMYHHYNSVQGSL